MAYTITLTEDQYAKLLADADKQKDMLTKEELAQIAEKLNKKINVPFIGEKREKLMLVKIVRNVDRFIYNQLPNELYEVIRDMESGLTDEEISTIKKRLGKLINEQVDIPYLPEALEQIALEFVLGLIIEALMKSKTLESALKAIG